MRPSPEEQPLELASRVPPPLEEKQPELVFEWQVRKRPNKWRPSWGNLPSAFFKIRREREREERPPAQVGIWGAAAAEALLQQKPIFGRAGPSSSTSTRNLTRNGAIL